ncbi:MAG: MarR family transcriptional regulator [Opitutales bacterium]|nr:MarR family transcriptional regulator [Opitutales bacterium]
MHKENARRLPTLLRSCWITLNATFQKRLLPFEITPDQYIALRWLYERGDKETNQVTLATLMCTDANNISGLISRMITSGLLQRKASIKDNRMKCLNLTAAGREKFKKTIPVARFLEKEVLADLRGQEREIFLRLLSRLSSFLNHSA